MQMQPDDLTHMRREPGRVSAKPPHSHVFYFTVSTDAAALIYAAA